MAAVKSRADHWRKHFHMLGILLFTFHNSSKQKKTNKSSRRNMVGIFVVWKIMVWNIQLNFLPVVRAGGGGAIETLGFMLTANDQPQYAGGLPIDDCGMWFWGTIYQLRSTSPISQPKLFAKFCINLKQFRSAKFLQTWWIEKHQTPRLVSHTFSTKVQQLIHQTSTPSICQ